MSNAAEQIRSPEELVNDYARTALERAGGDVKKAALILEDEVRQSARLFRELMTPLLSSACMSAVGMVHRHAREKIWNTSKAASEPSCVVQMPTQGRSDAEQIAYGVRLLAAANLLMFPLPGGLPLGEAKRGEVEGAAQEYKQKSDNMGHKARWLQLIAQSLPSDTCVKDVLTAERLSELQDEARNG